MTADGKVNHHYRLLSLNMFSAWSLAQDNDYQAAAAMAFELGHAKQLLDVVNVAMSRGDEEAQQILNTLVANLDANQIKQCMEFVREWNTNSRHCHAAQATLQAILTQYSPEVQFPMQP